MTAPSHIVTGLATVVILGRVVGETPDAVNLLTFLVGTLAPDIDGNGAITRPGTILRNLVGRGIANLIDAVFEFISEAVQLVFQHRGFLHSPFVAFCIFALGGVVGMHWIEWFAIGYASHLLGDAMTAGGIPMWMPFSDEDVSLTEMETGSGTEAIVAIVLLVFACVFGWELLPEEVKEIHQLLYQTIAQSV